MEQKILNTKRKLLADKDSEEERREELNTFRNYVSKSHSMVNKCKEKARNRNKNKFYSSGNLRVISVLKGEKEITLSTEKISEFQDFITLSCMPATGRFAQLSGSNMKTGLIPYNLNSISRLTHGCL